jgi:hypothetical protein
MAQALAATTIPAARNAAAEIPVLITPSCNGALVARAFLKRNGRTDGAFPFAFQTNPGETVYKFLTTPIPC